MISTLLIFAALGQAPNYLENVPDVAAFEQISVPSRSRPDLRATTKFLVPARDDPSLLQTVYQNVDLYPFHLDFMTAEFSDRFPGLDDAEYRRIVQQRAGRQYFAGTLNRIRTDDDEELWGVDFYTDPASEDELPLPEEVEWVLEQVRATCALRPVVYAPIERRVLDHVEDWEDVTFRVYVPEGTAGNYAAYTTGTAYGVVRFHTVETVAAASDEGSLTVQDIIVVDEAPGDLTSPVGAVVTGTSQTELSHLNLRLAQRGTPNVFAADFAERLDAFRDQLVRIDVSARTLEVRLAETDEAETWWQENRPRLPGLPTFDLSVVDLASLDEIATVPDAVAKYGAKATNLALLRTVLPSENVANGFAVPFAWYQRFLEESRILVLDQGRTMTYLEYLEYLEDDEDFRTDPVYRTSRLDDLVNHAEDHGFVAPEIVTATMERMQALLGAPEVKARFRSSSNFEDIVPFNGAGLYRSTSACAADNLDGDDEDPSLCDPTNNERTLERGFRRVWSSVWLPRAYNEREFWQAPHDVAKMGVLVNPAFVEEEANGVVLTGNPVVPGDDRILINVQAGEESVVSPEPGVLAEKILVEVDGGAVTRVDRVRPSTEVPEGEWVLSIDEARTVAELVTQAAEAFVPRFETALGDILLDLEFKVVADDEGNRRVVFKQMRPFLREADEEAPTLAVIVPPATEVCGVFQEFRTLGEEYDVLSVASFVSGRLELPGRAGTVTGDLIEELRIGLEQTVAVPQSSGEFTCDVSPGDGLTDYRYEFQQDFTVGGATLSVAIRFPVFTVFASDAEGESNTELVLDDLFLSSLAFSMRGNFPDGTHVGWASCEYLSLSLFHTSVRATTGETLDVTTRHHGFLIGTGPENIVAATFTAGDETRTSTNYWDLVHAADHHNENREYWVFLDPPVGDAHVAEYREPVVVRGQQIEEAVFRLLDADLSELRVLEIVEESRDRVLEPEAPDFVRGDANISGEVDLADAVRILNALFLGDDPLTCLDAADADDDGAVTISDAVGMLNFLFRGADEQEPPWPGPYSCGHDFEPDGLPACDYDVGMCPTF